MGSVLSSVAKAARSGSQDASGSTISDEAILDIPGMLRTMAELQAKLHSLSTDGCPVPYERPLVDDWLSQSQGLVRKFRPDGLDRPLAWLEVVADSG